MLIKLDSPLSRRGLLRTAMMAGAMAAAGCGEQGVQQVTTPAGEGGNRSKLQKLEKTAEEKSKAQKKPR